MCLVGVTGCVCSGWLVDRVNVSSWSIGLCVFWVACGERECI